MGADIMSTIMFGYHVQAGRTAIHSIKLDIMEEVFFSLFKSIYIPDNPNVAFILIGNKLS